MNIFFTLIKVSKVYKIINIPSIIFKTLFSESSMGCLSKLKTISIPIVIKLEK